MERQFRNEIWDAYDRRPWKTEPDRPAGSVGYCGPTTESEKQEDADNE